MQHFHKKSVLEVQTLCWRCNHPKFHKIKNAQKEIENAYTEDKMKFILDGLTMSYVDLVNRRDYIIIDGVKGVEGRPFFSFKRVQG